MREMPTQEYAARTAANVRDANGTLIICRGEPTGGTRATLEFCRRFGKPHLVIDCEQTAIKDQIQMALQFVRSILSQSEATDLRWDKTAQNKTEDLLRVSGVTTLNVAGPRASQWPGGREIAYRILSVVLRRLSGHEGSGEYSGRDSPRGEF